MRPQRSLITILGFDDNNKAAGIPRKDQIHTAIFGEVGSGKSTVNTIMINQNINRGEGFLVLDPHGSLAQDVIRMIPESKKHKLVYISLDSVTRWGKTIKINPLEVKDLKERYVIVMNFVQALKNIYRDSWGPQLEMILRNAANALVEIEGSTLRDMVKIITDPRMRSVYLNRVANPDVRNFWSVLYEQYYQKDAGRAAYNKLDKILATPQVAAMLDTPRSTIDFENVIESGKWVVIDLSSGGSDDVVSFVGTILINMVYVEAKKRFGNTEADHKPFFMYIDEAHLFAPFALRELLNTMRKANVKVAITSQTLNTFPRDFAKEVSALVRTIVCFKVDIETASMFKTVMPVPIEVLTSLSHGRFAFYSQGDPPLSGLLRVFPIVDRKRDWMDLARQSVAQYGEKTSLEKYITPTKKEGDGPQVSPLEAAILLLLYNENRDMTRDELCDFIQKMFDVPRKEVLEKLEDILMNRLRLVERKNVRTGDGDRNLATRYVLSSLAYNSVFSQAAMGRRAGSDLHLATIFMIMAMQQQSFKFCIPDLGDSGKQRPDLLVFEPQKIQNSSSETMYDPLQWSNKVIAVEVETDPTKHSLQVLENFEKNFEFGHDTWFVVFSEKHRQYITELLEKNRVDRKLYKISIVEPESVERLSNVQNNSVAHLTREELEIYNALGRGRTAKSVAERVGLSSYDVMAILWRLEQKGLAERGYAETKKAEVNLVSGMKSTETRRKEYFVSKQVANLPISEPLDFSKLSDTELKDLVLHPRCGSFAKKLLENRGNEVSIMDGKVDLRKKTNWS